MSDEIVAILDLKFIEDTGDTSMVLCYDENDEECGTWATYYLFEARVRKTIRGELPNKRFRVLYGQHALKKKDFYTVIALLEPIDPPDPGVPPDPNEPQYRLRRGEKRTMYCFDYVEGDDTDVVVERNDQIELSCYDRKTYR